MRNNKTKINVYVHRTHKMRSKNKNKFNKGDRPRIEVKAGDGKYIFMYADQLMDYIINNFEYEE